MKVVLYIMMMGALVKACAKGCAKSEGRIASELASEGAESFARSGSQVISESAARIGANGIPPVYDGVLNSWNFHPLSRAAIKYITRSYNGVHYDSLQNELFIDNKVRVIKDKELLEKGLKKPNKSMSEFLQIKNNYVRVYKIDRGVDAGILPVSSIYYSDTTVVSRQDLVETKRDTTHVFEYAVNSSDQEYYQMKLVKFDKNNLMIKWKTRTEQSKGLFVKQDLDLSFKMTPDIFRQYERGDTVMLFLNDESKQVWESSINVLNKAMFGRMMNEDYKTEVLNKGVVGLEIFEGGAQFFDKRVFLVRGIMEKVDLTNY
jgi:hypothetical protein